ncbi:MAG: hypothetical protein LIP77_00365 [Planctomycetes bacterium]|nr:hypothetical protein [Planctomycetota bacterium]
MPYPAFHRQAGGYRLCGRDDGTDYWRLVVGLLEAGVDRARLATDPAARDIAVRRDGREIRYRALTWTNPRRHVFRVYADGQSFILKWMRQRCLGLDRLLPGWPGVTRNTRLFRLVRRAVDQGCDRTQDYLLVAERPLAPFVRESVVLLEYLAGEPLGRQPDLGPFTEELRATVTNLIRHGLTLDDLSPFNFLVTDSGIKAIDLSCRRPTRLQAVKMLLKMNTRYGLGIPVRGLVDTILARLLAARYALRRLTGKRDFS